jgi:prohibitin 2
MEDVSITHLGFSKEYAAAVEKKQVAKQESERARFIVEKAKQEKQAIIIRSQGTAQSARLIGESVKENPGFVHLRRLETAKEIADIVTQSQNKIYLNADALLLNIISPTAEVDTATAGQKKKSLF